MNVICITFTGISGNENTGPLDKFVINIKHISQVNQFVLNAKFSISLNSIMQIVSHMWLLKRASGLIPSINYIMR